MAYCWSIPKRQCLSSRTVNLQHEPTTHHLLIVVTFHWLIQKNWLIIICTVWLSSVIPHIIQQKVMILTTVNTKNPPLYLSQVLSPKIHAIFWISPAFSRCFSALSPWFSVFSRCFLSIFVWLGLPTRDTRALAVSESVAHDAYARHESDLRLRPARAPPGWGRHACGWRGRLWPELHLWVVGVH